MKIHTTGLSWYKESQYEDFKKLCEDGYNLPNTYADWLKKAEHLFESLKSQGHNVIKVEVDINEFRVFCTANGHKFNSAGREAFGNYKVAVSTGLIK